jgi:hypothetical protein
VATEEIEVGCGSALLIIKRNKRRLILEETIKNSLRKLKFSVRVGVDIMNYMSSMVFESNSEGESVSDGVAHALRFPRGQMSTPITLIFRCLNYYKSKNHQEDHELDECYYYIIKLCIDNGHDKYINLGFATVMNNFFREIAACLSELDD